MKHILILLFLLIPILSCSQKKEGELSKEFYDALWERELAIQNRAKYSKSGGVVILTDEQDVQKIRNWITKKLDSVRKEETKRKSIGGRYKAGDKSVIPEIVESINSMSKETRWEIYRELSLNYDDPEDYSIKDQSIIEALHYNLVHLPQDRDLLVQLMGYAQVEGYQEAFKQLLVEEKAEEQERRIIYWLSKEGKDEAVYKILKDRTIQPSFDLEEQKYVVEGLANFAENGDDKIKSELVRLFKNMIENGQLKQTYIDEAKEYYSSANPAHDIMNVLFTYGGEEVLPLAYHYLKEGVFEEEAIHAIVRITKDVDFFKNYNGKNEDSFFDTLDAATELFDQTKDLSIVETIVENINLLDSPKSYQLDRIAINLRRMDVDYAKSVIETSDLSAEHKQYLLDNFIMSLLSIEDFAEELFQTGVVAKPLSEETLFTAKTDCGEECDISDYGHKLYSLLTAANLIHWFDAETGIWPNDYDVLLTDIFNISQGQLDDALVFMDYKADDDYNTEYVVYVIHEGTAFIIEPEDFGDWYDIGVVMDLVNAVCEHAGLKEKYHILETGGQDVQLFFGPQEPAEAFIKKYHLSVE